MTVAVRTTATRAGVGALPGQPGTAGPPIRDLRPVPRSGRLLIVTQDTDKEAAPCRDGRSTPFSTILSIGLIGTFLGHGAWAIGGNEKFVGLLTGSLDHVLGLTLSASTAETIVRIIGAVDLVLAAAMTVMLIGALRGAGDLYRLAYSNIAVGVYVWAIVWGFVTAAARMTAAGALFPEIWDLVERAPNWMLPMALTYLVVATRTAHPEAPLFVPDIVGVEGAPESISSE